jgi:hypothetical protein
VDERARRLARNEAVFREVNEHIEVAAARMRAAAVDAYEFMCECGDPACRKTIRLTLLEYEAVRAHPARFCVAPGHLAPTDEMLVETYPAYSLVEKLGEAADEAKRLDPR